MKKVNHYEFEGAVVEIPLCWDERSRQFVEDYGNFIENPVRTPAGCPILLTIEDACPHADLVDDGPLSIDCGSCSYFRQPAESVLGVCHNEKMRCVSVKQGNTGASQEET